MMRRRGAGSSMQASRGGGGTITRTPSASNFRILFEFRFNARGRIEVLRVVKEAGVVNGSWSWVVCFDGRTNEFSA